MSALWFYTRWAWGLASLAGMSLFCSWIVKIWFKGFS